MKLLSSIFSAVIFVGFVSIHGMGRDDLDKTSYIDLMGAYSRGYKRQLRLVDVIAFCALGYHFVAPGAGSDPVRLVVSYPQTVRTQLWAILSEDDATQIRKILALNPEERRENLKLIGVRKGKSSQPLPATVEQLLAAKQIAQIPSFQDVLALSVTKIEPANGQYSYRTSDEAKSQKTRDIVISIAASAK